ncbi:hypothetical protein [Desulfarculus baarsii]|nr:hypothetical protein [Desulfarculus baarsii]
MTAFRAKALAWPTWKKPANNNPKPTTRVARPMTYGGWPNPRRPPAAEAVGARLATMTEEQFNPEIYQHVQTLLAKARQLCQLSGEYGDANEFVLRHGQDIKAVTDGLEAILPFWASMAESAGVSAELCDNVTRQLALIKHRLTTRAGSRH